MTTLRCSIILLALSLLACTSGDRETSESASRDGATSDVVYTGPQAAPEPAPVPPTATPEADFAQGGPARATRGLSSGGGAQFPTAMPSSAMLIRTGTASIEVERIATGIANVRQLAGALGGHIANTAVQTGRDQVPSATLELKIPATRFDNAVNGLEPIGRVESVNVEATDVGEEYVDVSARVANATRLEQRLVALLAARTGRLEDVLAVERELARVREEIERYQGRLRYLDARTSMSTLVVTVHEPLPVLGRPRSPIGDAFRQAWRNFVGVVAAVIAALGVLVPLGVILLGGFLVGRRVWRSRPLHS